MTAVVFSIRRNLAVRRNGVETDAVISRIKEKERSDSDGNIDITYVYYVRFRTKDGNTVEAKLGGRPPIFAHEGDKVRIKYLPEKPKYAILAE